MRQFLLLVLFVPTLCFAQGDQTIINVPIDAFGHTEIAILHLPDDYKTSTTKYPLMVFLHGVGQAGTDPSLLYNNEESGGPSYYIAHGQFPSSFVNPADKQSYKYIVVTPQSTSIWSTSAPQLDYVLTYLFKTYRADPARLYLTGLSAGGGDVMQYCSAMNGNGNPVTTTHKVAAMIPMSAVLTTATTTATAAAIANDNTHFWGFGSMSDDHGVETQALEQLLDKDKSNLGIFTTYSGGHCCWGNFYTPSFTQNGMNIYQWALQYTQGTPSGPSSGTPPTSGTPPSSGSTTGTSGTGFAIPGIIQAENYSAKTGTVATQPTTDVGGGLNVGWINNGDYMQYQVNVATAGTYTVSFRVATTFSDASFKLFDASGNTLCTVTAPNTGGFQDWQTVNATVKLVAGAQTIKLQSTSWDIWNINWIEFGSGTTALPSNGAQAIPGTIQASTYVDATGDIGTQATSDIGGGLNVGWIDIGTYMDYYVNVATAGTYTVNFRVATTFADASFELLDGSGNLLTSVVAPNTGGFQIWKTVAAKATLKAGAQTLRLKSTSLEIWNINWIQFALSTTTASTGATALVGTANSVSLDDSVAAATAAASATTGTLLWPNPVKGMLTIQLNDATSGDRIIQVVDAMGAVRQVTKFTKTPGVNQFQIDVATLSTGVYSVRVLSAGKQETIRILKL